MAAAANEVVAADPLAPRQWRCIWTEDPATIATLSWNTTAAGRQHLVRLKAIGGSGDDNGPPVDAGEERSVAAARNARFTGDAPPLYYHHARVAGLTPGTTYEVVFESDGRQSPPLRFTTAPADDRTVAILFGADSRSGRPQRQHMNRLLARLVAESYAAERTPILALAHGGDYIYDGNELALWSQWMTDHELTVGKEGRLLPIIPARGNHDHGEHFNEVFGFPRGDRDFYALNIGPQVRLITLNTETSMAGRQAKWLAAELAASRPEHRWLAAQYHRPAYPAVKLPSRALLHWVPLFEEFNVDLVCEGDGHTIKRTPPLRANSIDPAGVPYIGEGGLGVGQRTPKADRWYLQAPQAKVGSDHHVQLLTFGEQNLNCRVVLASGEIFDEHAWPVRPSEQRRAPRGEPAAPASRAASGPEAAAR